MPRHIDADELLKKIWYGNTDSIVLRSYAVELVKAMPTADVVPKSEVEKLIIDRNATRLGMIAEHERLKMAKAEVELLQVKIEHLTAEKERLQNLLNDLMKDEEMDKPWQ